MRTLFSQALISIVFWFPVSAFACSIPHSEWGRYHAEATTYLANNWGWPYNSSHVNEMVQWYEMDRGDWDNGWGWHAANDPKLPFARTMNALTLIRNAPQRPWVPAPDGNQYLDTRPNPQRDWLVSVKNFSRNSLDELDGRCRRGTTSARTWWGPFIDNRTALYVPFFYNSPLVEQAGIIIHEAHHASWDGHDGDDGCVNGASCDLTYHVWNANSLHMAYLWLLARSGWSLSDFQRDEAFARAETRAARNFNSPADISRWRKCIDRPYHTQDSSVESCY